MKNFTYELLAKSKSGRAVATYLTNDEIEVQSKAKDAAGKGFPVIIIKNENEKRTGTAIGPKTDWSKFSKIVTVTFGGKTDNFTYRTSLHWEVGDARFVNTPHGVRMAVIKEDARYVHINDIIDLEDRIGCSLKVFEEEVIE